MCEALLYAHRAGLDLEHRLQRAAEEAPVDRLAAHPLRGRLCGRCYSQRDRESGQDSEDQTLHQIARLSWGCGTGV